MTGVVVSGEGWWWRKGVEEQEAGWQAVPMVQIRRNTGLSWKSGRGMEGRGQNHSAEEVKLGLGEHQEEMTWASPLCAGERS